MFPALSFNANLNVSPSEIGQINSEIYGNSCAGSLVLWEIKLNYAARPSTEHSVFGARGGFRKNNKFAMCARHLTAILATRSGEGSEESFPFLPKVRLLLGKCLDRSSWQESRVAKSSSLRSF